MKKKPQQCARQGKSNSNIKSFLSNLKENDLHFEGNQITQCVFLGVLRLKPVPSVFSSNNVPSVVVEHKSKRFKNNNSAKEINKNVPRKKDINKVISGRVGKKNPDKIKASIKKLPTKKPVINLKFKMNRNQKESSSINIPETVRILPETLTKITPESVFTNQTITLNPITTVPTFNPVQNLFNKLKQQLDDRYNRPSGEVSKESLFFNELLDADNPKSSKKQKKSNKKNKSATPSSSTFSDNSYTKSSEEVIVFNDNDVGDEDCEVLLNTGPMPSFVLQTNNDVILIPDDNSNRSSPSRDLIVIDDVRNVRASPRLNKSDSAIQQKDTDVINLDDEADKKSQKPIKRRRTLMPSAIPSIFFNTPRLLRSELGQKKGAQLEAKSTKSSKQQKFENKTSAKPKKERVNMIYEVVKSTEYSTESDVKSQDQELVVENSPPKVEPLIIKLKKSTEKATNVTDQNGNEDMKSKEKSQKATKNIFFPRLLRSDIKTVNVKKTDTAEPIIENTTGKISVKSTKELFEDDSVPENQEDVQTEKLNSPVAEKKTVAEKPSSNNKKTEKSPVGARRTLRSDNCEEESNTVIEIIDKNENTEDQPIIQRHLRSEAQKKSDDSEIIDVDKNIAENQRTSQKQSLEVEIIDVDLYEEKSNNNIEIISRNLRSESDQIINIEEADTAENVDVIDVDNVEKSEQNSFSKYKSIAVVQPMSRPPKTPQKKIVNQAEVRKKRADIETITVAQFYDKTTKSKEATPTERRQLRSDDTQKLPNEKENNSNATKCKADEAETEDKTVETDKTRTLRCPSKSKADSVQVGDEIVEETDKVRTRSPGKSKADAVEAGDKTVSENDKELTRTRILRSLIKAKVDAEDETVSETDNESAKRRTPLRSTTKSKMDTIEAGDRTIAESDNDSVKTRVLRSPTKSKTDSIEADDKTVSETDKETTKTKTPRSPTKSKSEAVEAEDKTASETDKTKILLSPTKSKADAVEVEDTTVAENDKTGTQRCLTKSKLDAEDKTVSETEKTRTLRSNVAQKETNDPEDASLTKTRSGHVQKDDEAENEEQDKSRQVDDDTVGKKELCNDEQIKVESEVDVGADKLKKLKNRKVVKKKRKKSKNILVRDKKMKKVKKCRKRTADYQIMNQADLIVNTSRSQSKMNKLEKSTVEEVPKPQTKSQNPVKQLAKKVVKNFKKSSEVKKPGRPRKMMETPKQTADVEIAKQADTLIVHCKRNAAKAEKDSEIKTENNNVNREEIAKKPKKMRENKVSDAKVKRKRKKREDLDVITVVSEKKAKKQGKASPKILRSNLNPVVVKEETVSAPVVEKVVALIHSEPKPKDFYKSSEESDKNQPKTLKSQNFNDVDTIDVVKEVKRGRPKQNKDSQKKNGKKGTSEKSKAIKRGRKNKNETEKLKKERKTIMEKSKLSKIPDKSKRKLMDQVKTKLKKSKKGNPFKTAKSKRKSNIDWQNNDIIERIIQEIKNTIFKQDPNEKKAKPKTNMKPKKTDNNKKKKVLRAAKKKMQRTKEALKRKLRSARSMETNDVNTATKIEPDKIIEEEEQNAANKNDTDIIINEITVPKNVDNLEETINRDADAKKNDITVFDFDETEPEVLPLRPAKTNDAPIIIPDDDATKSAETQMKTLYSVISSSEDESAKKKRLNVPTGAKLYSRIKDTTEYDKRIFFENPSNPHTQQKRLYSEILVYSDEEDEEEEGVLIDETSSKTVPTESTTSINKEGPARKKKLLIPFLDDDGKPRKLWSIIDTPSPQTVTPFFPPFPPPPQLDLTAPSTSKEQEKSPESTASSEKKSPLKQPTIIEMFSKVWMKKESPVKTLSEETDADALRRCGTATAPSPAENNHDDDDDSDAESRVEWMPEEYAEYKFKYSSNKMMQYKPIFKCKICMLMLPSYYKLLKHRKEHEKQDKPYNCPQCRTDFGNVDDFYAHLRIHKGKHPYMCTKCDAGFWTKGAYEAHIPVHILKKAKQPVKKFRCDICAKEFSKLCDVERHTRVHTGEKPCICNICNKRFQQAHNLSKHLITHLHIKPFHCEICNKQFGRNDVLRRHLFTHSVDKPVKCSVCFRGFIRHTQLLQHMRRKHPDTPIDDLREQYGDEEDMSDNREEFDEQPSSSSGENTRSIKTEG